MNALMHLLIGFIALRMALGSPPRHPDRSGALASLAEAPGGSVLLMIGAVGTAALAFWNVLAGWLALRRRPRPLKKLSVSVSAFAKAVFFAVAAVTAARFSVGAGSSTSSSERGATAAVIGNPFGRALVFAVGAVVVGIGIYFVVKGVSRRFERDLRNDQGRLAPAVVITGTIGFVAEGGALLGAGTLVLWAAVGADARKAAGLDAAMSAIAALPAGSALLGLVGSGLMLYGVYLGLRTWFADMSP